MRRCYLSAAALATLTVSAVSLESITAAVPVLEEHLFREHITSLLSNTLLNTTAEGREAKGQQWLNEDIDFLERQRKDVTQ